MLPTAKLSQPPCIDGKACHNRRVLTGRHAGYGKARDTLVYLAGRLAGAQTIFLERTRKGPSSIYKTNIGNCFKGNVGETPERRGDGAHMGLPERNIPS